MKPNPLDPHMPTSEADPLATVILIFARRGREIREAARSQANDTPTTGAGQAEVGCESEILLTLEDGHDQ